MVDIYNSINKGSTNLHGKWETRGEAKTKVNIGMNAILLDIGIQSFGILL